MQRAREDSEEQETANKRRCVSQEPEGPMVVSPAVSLSNSQSSEDSQSSEASLVEPKLEEIPKLLMEDLPSDDATVVAAALQQVGDLCHDGTSGKKMAVEKRKEAHQAGAIIMVATTMKKWRNDKEVQREGCRSLANMMCKNQGAKESFAMVGGMEIIITAMRTFPNSFCVRDNGVGAIENFYGGNTNKEQKKRIAERFVNDLEGIKLIVDSMKRFSKNAIVQTGGCCIFVDLCKIDSGFKPFIRKSGAISAVGCAIDNHLEDEEIQKRGEECMKLVFA